MSNPKRIIALLSLIRVGCIVYVPAGEAERIAAALVTKIGDGCVWARPERCPTKAERSRGDYDRWVKQARRYELEQIRNVDLASAARAARVM